MDWVTIVGYGIIYGGLMPMWGINLYISSKQRKRADKILDQATDYLQQAKFLQKEAENAHDNLLTYCENCKALLKLKK